MELYRRYLITGKKDPAKGGAEPGRSAVAKDRDRIIHSSAFRRLQGKSQVMGAQAGDYFRTRLTHSLECAQIGRTIARRVRSGWDSVVERKGHLEDLVESACLAHDLGHPPFGHNGERALRELMELRAHKLFEGNAQSFRVLTFGEPKAIGAIRDDYDRWVGLNLTRTTLMAICKYPYVETAAMRNLARPKFSVYDDPHDREVFEWVWDGQTPSRTLATRIMDVADDIAYAAHDLEDGVWAGMIPLYDLIEEDEHAIFLLHRKITEKYADGRGTSGTQPPTPDDVVGSFRALIKAVTREAKFEKEQLNWAHRPYEQTRQNLAYLKRFSAACIGIFVDACVVRGEFREPPPEVRTWIDILTGAAWVWMIDRPDLVTTQFGQRRLVADLFNGYWEDPATLPRPEEVEEIGGALLPDQTWPEMARAICDHVAGMTDTYAIHAHRQMYAGETTFRLRYAR